MTVLTTNLNEEKAADKKLSALAERRINQQAAGGPRNGATHSERPRQTAAATRR